MPAVSASEPSYPTRPLRLVIASSPGSSADIIGRVAAEKLGERLRQQVIADNRAGAGGNVGAEIVARSAPDGHTLLLSTTTFTMNVSLYRNLRYDLLKDFVPVGLIVRNGSFVLVTNPALPATSVRELVAAAKSRPGQINYASAGNGNSLHLAGELFRSIEKIDITHIPYKGSGPALTAVIAGEAQMMFATVLAATPHMRSNRLRPLAVTGDRRVRSLPSIPTMMEAGVQGYVVSGWYGLLAPAGTPASIVNVLHTHLMQIMKQPEMARRFEDDGSEPDYRSPAEMTPFIRSEIAKWAKVIREANIVIEE